MISLIIFLFLVGWTLLGVLLAFAKALSLVSKNEDTKLQVLIMLPVIVLVFLYDKFCNFIKRP